MALDFTEKQHWKNRIEAKLNRRIASLRCEHAVLIHELNRRAYDEVISSLGLTRDFGELERLDDARLALEEEEKTILLSMQRKISGGDSDGKRWGLQCIHSRLDDLRQEKAANLMLELGFGRELEALRAGRESLVDAVLLATDIQHVTGLWGRVTSLVTDQIAGPVQETLFRDREDDPADGGGA